jgi:hypothetical protein
LNGDRWITARCRRGAWAPVDSPRSAPMVRRPLRESRSRS